MYFFLIQVRQGDTLPEELVQKMCGEMRIRYLTIGGPVVYGEKLQNNQTYPSLLCNGDRIAGPHLKPQDALPCLKKMIGNNMYDVIVLDLYRESNEKLIQLTRRLANRYPQATIMSIRHFFPGDLGFKHRRGWISIQSWAKYYGHTSMTKEALGLFEKSSKAWTIRTSDTSSALYGMNSKENYVWSVFKDTNDKYSKVGDYWKDALLRRAWMYDDWYEPNAFGHMDIARGILSLSLWKDTETHRSDEVFDWDGDSEGC